MKIFSNRINIIVWFHSGATGVAREEIVSTCMSYINNDADQRTVDEFLLELEKEYLRDAE